MDKDVKLANVEQCTGCGACKMKCPKGAITFSPDNEGFPSPSINEELCVGCGICNKVCPAIYPPVTHKIISTYAAQTKDDAVLKNSTSGGLFTVFAREIFRRDGVVYGCVWDENYNAFIRKAENENELKPMRGSKYVWSWSGDTFPEIRSYLENNRVVLFTGLPCQVAGLKNYLSKDYENLFLLDFLCSGTPSPLALDRYLDTICTKEDRKNLNLKFRDKDPYGVGVHITYNGKKKNIKKGESIKNSYYWGFFSRLIDRNSCYKCNYGSEKRFSDITLGDYWGISNYHNEFDTRAGVSALLINSEKGISLLDSVIENLNISPTEVENITKYNNLVVGDNNRNISVPKNRTAFFEELKKNGWKSAEKKYMYNKSRLKQYIKKTFPKPILKLFRF